MRTVSCFKRAVSKAVAPLIGDRRPPPQARMFDGIVCVSDAIAMLTVLAYVLLVRRDVARARCVPRKLRRCRNEGRAFGSGFGGGSTSRRVGRLFAETQSSAPQFVRRALILVLGVASHRGLRFYPQRGYPCASPSSCAHPFCDARSCSLRLAFTEQRLWSRTFLIFLAWC